MQFVQNYFFGFSKEDTIRITIQLKLMQIAFFQTHRKAEKRNNTRK